MKLKTKSDIGSRAELMSYWIWAHQLQKGFALVRVWNPLIETNHICTWSSEVVTKCGGLHKILVRMELKWKEKKNELQSTLRQKKNSVIGFVFFLSDYYKSVEE